LPCLELDAAGCRVATTITQELLRATKPGAVSNLDASVAGQAAYEQIGFIAENSDASWLL